MESTVGLRVLGIDPGLTRCGLSIVQAGRGRTVIPVAVGVARTPYKAAMGDRLKELYEAITEWIAEYKPDVVAMERLFERGEVSTVLHTAHAVGVLILAASQAGLDVHEYTPSQVKKAITGNGKADKKQMTAMVTRILGLENPPKPADAADALAIAITHCWRAPQIQREEQAKQQLRRMGIDPDRAVGPKGMNTNYHPRVVPTPQVIGETLRSLGGDSAHTRNAPKR
ncbi:crossover junction endodeoxyribonuclease RuvC [Corynebacterium pyruviciproducens]|uniref:Crossover junction endodeoxyribonuclease RuvC n=1 Tax=Corynebacterium pyruviciproducens TaxID=598660 RepID=A0AAF0YUQ6_9CORY|nr:crossover junction endodeoxyribonuclease RuvC [Corynebacterium pyruviciproducens]MDH4658396.1 crossover junction endodeoxyribonuclease RuvC [Corynebacterium pyruviciproducens]MDK6566052.1 crossover junction endodeoxyribonuclease RuvC [Corynebacterium pyruviciproducens]WOT03191.1 crossover junction endodeoxyribonuclease RuvC [Corynebacterium pyruviciproducens]